VWQALRVPLDGEQAMFPVLDHLDETILSSTHRVEAMSDDLDSLVVNRIHVELSAADDLCEQGFGFEEDAVNCLVAPAWLSVADAILGWEVLAERPAERDVHQLGASTDSENRNPTVDGGRDKGELTPISLVVDVGSLPLETRAVTGRRDVAAAGQEHSVDALYRSPREFGRCGWDE